MNKARINNWTIQQGAEPNQFVLHGNLQAHDAAEAQDGYTTEPLRSVDFERGIALTANTEYTLVAGEQVPA